MSSEKLQTGIHSHQSPKATNLRLVSQATKSMKTSRNCASDAALFAGADRTGDLSPTLHTEEDCGCIGTRLKGPGAEGSDMPGRATETAVDPKNMENVSSTTLLAEIVDSSDDVIVSKTLDGVITSWNKSAERILGYTAAEAIGQHITLIIPPEFRAEENQVLARLRRGERVEHFETVRQAKDGRRLKFSLTISPVRDSTGRLVGASKVGRDITDRVQAEKEREELLALEKAAREEAQRANRSLDEKVEALRREAQAREKAQAELAEALNARDEFIAVAAHELRNPLNVLTLTAQLLQRTSGDPEKLPKVRGLIDESRIQISRLAALVDRLFDVTQIRADRFELYKERCDLGSLVREVTTRFIKEHPDVSISFELASSIEGMWDYIRIDQTLTNLLSNAIKFGEGKPVTVRVSVEEQEAVIRIRDQGPGMSPEDLERVFNRFERARTGSDRKGLGLGLFITKRIVTSHGGTIFVECEPGKGCEFIIRLPIRND